MLRIAVAGVNNEMYFLTRQRSRPYVVTQASSGGKGLVPEKSKKILLLALEYISV